MKCPNCGADASTKFCPYCGSEMPYNGPDTVINDNKTIINNYYYGDTYEDVINDKPIRRKKNVSSKRKSTALIWCILLGVFGGHYFYVGKIGKGILYLFTAGLFSIGWIIDIIRIASGNFTDSNGLILNIEPMTLREKGNWFLGLAIFGAVGVLVGISELNFQAIVLYLIWTGIFGYLFYTNKKKLEE